MDVEILSTSMTAIGNALCSLVDLCDDLYDNLSVVNSRLGYWERHHEFHSKVEAARAGITYILESRQAALELREKIVVTRNIVFDIAKQQGRTGEVRWVFTPDGTMREVTLEEQAELEGLTPAELIAKEAEEEEWETTRYIKLHNDALEAEHDN